MIKYWVYVQGGICLLFAVVWMGCSRIIPTTYAEQTFDELFAVTLPSTLSEADSLNVDARLQLQNFDRDFFVLGRYNSWKILRAKRPEATLEDYYNYTVEKVLLPLSSPQATAEDSVSINGLVGLQGYIQGVHNGNEILYKLTVISGSDYLYQFLCWTELNKQELYEPEMDRIVNSFRELQREEIGAKGGK